jgi:TonB family protein
MGKGSIAAPIVWRLIFVLLTAFSAVSPAMAQQGNIHITYAPFLLPNMTERGGVATFSPIDTIDGKTIQLRSDDGRTFTFELNPKTVYCQGSKEAIDWTYLKKMIGQKTSITVMTNEGVDYALVVWDQAPKTIKGPDVFPNFAFPAICKAGVQLPKSAGAAANAPATRPPAAAATPGATTSSASIKVPGDVQATHLIRQIKPVYPPLAKMARIQGTVRFDAVIAKDGTVKQLHILSGHPMLQHEAIEAVQQWLYSPTLLNGEPVEVLTTIDVNFALDQ